MHAVISIDESSNLQLFKFEIHLQERWLVTLTLGKVRKGSIWHVLKNPPWSDCFAVFFHSVNPSAFNINILLMSKHTSFFHRANQCNSGWLKANQSPFFRTCSSSSYYIKRKEITFHFFNFAYLCHPFFLIPFILIVPWFLIAVLCFLSWTNVSVEHSLKTRTVSLLTEQIPKISQRSSSNFC